MPHRPLVFVSGLTFGDYLLWNWSLNGSHTALALVSGLTLPPLVLACLWLVALTLTRLIAYLTRRSLARPAIARALAQGRRGREAGHAGHRRRQRGRRRAGRLRRDRVSPYAHRQARRLSGDAVPP